MKATELPKERLDQLLRNADEALITCAEVLAVGDVNDAAFKQYCQIATQAVMVRAAITSMEVMR